MKKSKNDNWMSDRYDDEARSPIVSAVGGNIRLITIQWNYGNAIGDKPNNWIIKPTDKFYFFMECNYRECVEGGFNLTDIVRDTIRRKEPQAGTMPCRGWGDEERYNKFSCDSTLSYVVTVEVY